DDAPADADSSFEASLLGLVEKALRDFDAARAREGAALSLTFEEILQRVDKGVTLLDAARAGISDRILGNLRERIEKLAAGIPLDEARLAQEVAQLADRADITEEIDRLKTHLAETRRLLAAGGPVGRRLDHLAQELHREVNTSGSKVREAGATKLVLDLKSELEAFKEQVQNVE
ncbi:MAG: endoribonuclease YicC domain-containing protein, partial [Thermoanaerobaculia bacterium]